MDLEMQKKETLEQKKRADVEDDLPDGFPEETVAEYLMARVVIPEGMTVTGLRGKFGEYHYDPESGILSLTGDTLTGDRFDIAISMPGTDWQHFVIDIARAINTFKIGMN